MAPWKTTLTRAWQGRGPLARALWPISLLYGLLVRLRWVAYRRGWLPSTRLPVPVIVVGNVVVGGAGKTPTVMAIVRHLQQQGHFPGVVSGGYGRTMDDKDRDNVVEVNATTPARLAGDEPLLIQRSTGVPVFVAKRRVLAAKALLNQHPATTVLICDDGLQHLALHADIRIAVFDERGIGNGWLLPAGLLREPWPLPPSGRPVSMVLRIGQASTPGKPLPCPEHVPVFHAHRHLAEHALSAQGDRVPMDELKRFRFTALAGIAKPQAFFDMLAAAGFVLEDALALADHQEFEDKKDSIILNIIKHKDTIFTEKDAVKIFPLMQKNGHSSARFPELVCPQTWAVPLVLTLNPDFFAALDEKLSSPHGHQTA